MSLSSLLGFFDDRSLINVSIARGDKECGGANYTPRSLHYIQSSRDEHLEV